MESKFKFSISGFTRELRIGIIVLVIVMLMVVAHFASRIGSDVKGSYFTVIVDCGSTGTRVSVFEWGKQSGSNQSLPVLMHSYPDNLTNRKGNCEYHCLQTEPGLDKFVGNASGVRASLEPLIALARIWVPEERHGDTPIFVLATAGLRRLAVEDSRRVLDNVEAVLKEHTFMYRKSWIRVLRGEEEAYYGWVALNYLMGSLGSFLKSPTLGLLDLGGSSLQVVMETDEARDGQHFIRSNISSLEHHILAYSLSDFGLNEAFDRTIVMLSQGESLMEGARDKLELKHPCLSSDFEQNYTCYGCLGLNMTVSDQANLHSRTHRTEFPSLYLVGEPNWERCKALARTVAVNASSLDWSQSRAGLNCKPGFSSDNGNIILNLTAAIHPLPRFHALSGFFAVYNLLNLNPRANLTALWEKGQELCSKSSDELRRISNQSSAGQYCFRVPYMASLIEDALCLGDAEIIFGPGNVSWTLGAAVVEGEFLWDSANKIRTHISVLQNLKAISSPVFVFVLLACLLFVVYRTWIKLSKKSDAAVALPTYSHPKRWPDLFFYYSYMRVIGFEKEGFNK